MRKKAVLIEFGKVIRSARIEKDMTQMELAEMTDLHRNYIGMIERGEKSVSLIYISKLAKALGMEIKELF